MSATRLRLVSKEIQSNPCKSLPPSTPQAITIADLYAGIGGFHLAFHQVGISCRFAVEKDKHARATYQQNFRKLSPELFEKNYFFHDVDELAKDPERIPDFSILCAGFPCQSFSIAGKRKGLHDPINGKHFFSLLKILKAKKPEAFLFENVRGLLSANKGEAFRLMERRVRDLGYSFHWQILRACDQGLPQLRPRLFMVGFRDRSTPFRFPEPIPLQKTMSDVFGAPCHRDIGKTVLSSGRNRRIGQSRNWDCFLVNGKERWLTTREVKQMQGFPDWFDFPVSQPQAMKQLGNAVAVPVVKAIAVELIHSLSAQRQQTASAKAA